MEDVAVPGYQRRLKGREKYPLLIEGQAGVSSESKRQSAEAHKSVKVSPSVPSDAMLPEVLVTWPTVQLPSIMSQHNCVLMEPTLVLSEEWAIYSHGLLGDSFMF